MYTQYFKSKIFTLNFVAFVASFLTSLLTPSLTQAQSASITDNILSIPVVAIGDLFFRVDLVIVADTDPAELELHNAVALSDATVPLADIFDGGSGPDGIPPLEFPRFIDRFSSTLNPDELVIGVKSAAISADTPITSWTGMRSSMSDL